MDLIKEHPGPKDNGAQLKKSVEEEWRKWNSSTNESEIITHFSTSQVPVPCYRIYFVKVAITLFLHKRGREGGIWPVFMKLIVFIRVWILCSNSSDTDLVPDPGPLHFYSKGNRSHGS